MESLQQYQDRMSKKRRIRAQALAILRRAKDAGIPESEMRIGPAQLKSYLSPDFHDGDKGVDKVIDQIYNKANDLFRNKFIIIDGGDMYSRRKAGFAILFRMIACDYNGKFYGCQSVTHKFQSISSTAEMFRNDFADELKQYDVLFLEEFRKEQIKNGFEIQWFIDEVLSSRDLQSKPTIITFSNPVAGHGLSEENALTSTAAFGQYMCMLTQLDTKTIPNCLRIRVKPI
jgi:hypothetical protein